MFSIVPGNWFLSPLFVLGSAAPMAKQFSIRFQQNKFKDAYIQVQNTAEEVILLQKLRVDMSELKIDIQGWPAGTYLLYLEDEEHTYTYQLLTL